jgi:C_GCAxxG_C_C family probable redox protein
MKNKKSARKAKPGKKIVKPKKVSKTGQAVLTFADGFSCSQSIASTFGVDYGMSREQLLKVSGGFGAGMARLAETCGAVTGAFMVIGLKHGRSRLNDLKSKELTYELVREFARRFKARNGTIVCRELLGCDLGTAEGMKAAHDKNLISTRCPKFVKDAAEILEEML